MDFTDKTSYAGDDSVKLKFDANNKDYTNKNDDDDARRFKSAPNIFYRQLSRNHTQEKYSKLLWIHNNFIIDEIQKIYEEANTWTGLRALVAIYCGILVWIGCWNLLHYELKDFAKHYIWHKSMEIGAAIYGIGGVLMMFYVGTLYENAGFVGTWRQKTFYIRHLTKKVLFAYFGQFFYYICLFTYFDLIYDKQYHIKGTSNTMSMFIIDMSMWILGYIILMWSNTFWCISGVSPPWYKGKVIYIDDPISKHIKYIFQSCLVISAYSLIWSTSSRFLENYSEGSVWRELFYTAAGLLLFITTGSFVANSAIWTDDFKDDFKDDDGYIKYESDVLIMNDQKSTGLFSINIDEISDADLTNALNKLKPNGTSLDTVSNLYLKQKLMDNENNVGVIIEEKEKKKHCEQYVIYYIRGFISLESQILHTTGSWTFFDTYLFKWSIYRDIAFIIVGVIGLWWSKALLMKACITPFNVAGAHPDG
eukprot:281462_1